MSQPLRPLIGVTSSLIHNSAGVPLCQVGQAYTTAIYQADGLPLIIPLGLEDNSLDLLLSRVDGILFTGGADIDPDHYHGQPHPRVYGVSSARDHLEFALIEKTLAVDKPLLAICRGIQVLNVIMGGNLYTHIQDQLWESLKHDWFPNFPRDKLAHTVSLTCGSKLHDIYKADEIRVNSLHHQGIDRVGDGLEAMGFAPDGLVEALEVKGMAFALGVQWHPECLTNDPGSQALFKAFVEACL
ncbi:MAG: gamma-glutamyl-gamma-aminobutyrate hydrolase family protein [Anaerolineales bacterium]|jgi:putative glutamine amidotransferase